MIQNTAKSLIRCLWHTQFDQALTFLPRCEKQRHSQCLVKVHNQIWTQQMQLDRLTLEQTLDNDPKHIPLCLPYIRDLLLYFGWYISEYKREI